MKNKCVLPFIGLDYQNNSPCCILQNQDGTYWDNRKSNINDLMQDHIAGKKSVYCNNCWTDEDAGITSKRQRYNQIHKQYLTLTDRKVKMITIPTGNVCNLYCVTCGPNASSSWIKKQMSYDQRLEKNKYKIINGIDAGALEKITEVDHVEFLGGETLKSFSLWRHLSTLDKSISFSLQTNGTVELNQNQVELLKSFKNFNICFSLDGHGKIFEYLRQPAKWDKVQENIKQYIKNFGINRLSTYVTISNLNIFYIDEIVFNIFKAIPSRIELNLVHRPKQFAYDNLSNRVGIEVEKNNPGFFKNKKIEWRGTSSSLASMINNLERQDKFSKLKFEDHLPDFFYVLNGKPPTR